MPAIYRSPFAGREQDSGASSIVGFAAENAALGIADGYSFSDFTDGTSNTVLLFECDSNVPWTKPQDYSGDFAQTRISVDHPFIYLMADGSVQSMDKLDHDKFKKMMTRNGGETIAK